MNTSIPEDGVVTTQTAQVWLDEEGIIHEVVLESATAGYSEALENTKAFVQVAGGERRRLMADLSGVRWVRFDATPIMNHELMVATLSAVAIVPGGGVRKFFSKLFVRLRPTPYPVEFFRTQDEALAWLRSL